MEDIEKCLKDNEQILWKSSMINKYFITDLKVFKWLFYGGGFLFIFLLILFIIIGLMKTEYWWLFLIMAVIFPNFFTIPGILVYFNFKKRFMGRLQLNFKEFKNYENIYLLTNKRWIQKSIFVLDMDESSLSSDILEIKGDIAIANIDNIKMILVGKHTLKLKLYDYIMYIGFNLHSDIKFNLKEDINDWEPVYLGALIPFTEFPEFMKILLNLIPFQKEKHKYGTDLIYYRS